MKIEKNYNLSKLNTFGIDVNAKFFVEINSEEDLKELFADPVFAENKKFFLGGGSNVLFIRDFDGIVVKISMLGKGVVEDNDEVVFLEVSAGENWHDLVTYAVNNNWGGIENLAYIPGTVGAAPVQNIAAYGQNFSEVFESLDAFNIETGKIEKFNKAQCKFGYRDSIFKKELKGKYIILKIKIQLSKNPQIETSYYQIGIVRDSVKEELQKMSTPPYTIKDVYQAVVNIRKRKLPDPVKIPTVGSFFLNSVVSRKKYEELKKQISELQCYSPDQLYYKDSVQNEDFVKIATGRLLQELGWLGKWKGNVGVHEKHALVIITNGKATGEEVMDFAETIKKSYFERYGIKLETEVNIV
ncbi:MAG: UDP-N-acetylenolpyruvoylglucosamine reductase [Candidatus Nomurabacteria bacterium GW2011_GWA2_43_15]|uniref:UDP-N-acetylenolpyruvoylglucosamine reductase n=2 Tax=Candidatus Nomuraibacteriota TaxID=1752729 RepID=A0A0G1G1L3_9BACT|nr:MAG: UDP-N-acetylenolpyruvoylglucosamine reductase [Candidatus Nomurabacteria bacterium GW2011_GWA2_43_15]KKT19719.1 MAG: UDP-N-acetylenolpyruvoylglucosamine reductase [Candidatus Nomurabacteria bacterium GW2011_GWB1_43_7]KKT76425.1 MAG: UDP-N-acetylenolpyruvoylglucosamine reductase [Parcubacteria group bacterium GW2011_GWF2_44_7]